VNDSIDDARKLARLLRGIPVKINVIPFNPDAKYLPEFRRPPEETIGAFVEALAREKYTVTVRRSKGPDASAACGQLKGRETDARNPVPATSLPVIPRSEATRDRGRSPAIRDRILAPRDDRRRPR
jgi:23S rRNA (adenine2503-C2)-methyltransferase